MKIGVVRHRRDISAARGAGAHDDRDLRDDEGRQPCLVEEDAAEVVAVGEDLGLQREECPPGVDQVDARQAVLTRDLLSPEVLLDGQRVVRAALHGRVVRDDDALAPLDDADARDDAGRRRVAVVELPPGERVQLEKGRSRVDEPVDALACRQLATGTMALDRLLAAPSGDPSRALAQLRDERFHRGTSALERLVSRDVGREHPHRRLSLPLARRGVPAPDSGH